MSQLNNRDNFTKHIKVVDNCHSGKMAEIKLQDSYFDNQNMDEDYTDIIFQCKNKTNKPITIHISSPTVVTTIGSEEELEDDILCTLQPGESTEANLWINDSELKHSYLTPQYLTDRYGKRFENPELFLSRLSFQVFVEQGNDVDIEYSDWELKDTEIFDLADDEYDEENDIATVSVYYDGYVFRLGEGEYRRYRDEDGLTRAEYLCIGLYKNNKILFHYVDTTGEIVDYVKTIWNNTPDFAKEYLMDVLNKNENLALRMTLVPGTPTSYEIYYDGYKDRGLLAEPLIQWMLQHNDFAAETYRYTEILNGHQECVGTYSPEDISFSTNDYPPVRYTDYHSIRLFVNAVVDYWVDNISIDMANQIIDYKDIYALYNSDLWIVVCEQFIYPQKVWLQNMLKTAKNNNEISLLQNDQHMVNAMCEDAKSFACQILKTTRERLIDKRIAELKEMIAQRERELATPSYRPNDILYIYKGNIRCHRYGHRIIQATAVLHNKTDNEIELNVEYCTECKKFILDYTVFEQYRNRYGILVGNFRMVVDGEFDGEYDLAEESPLMLSGYNVSQRDGYTSRERHYILARIIHDGIMDKGDVIRYLSYFIRKNGAKRGNELALSKWEEDLAFVQNYDISTQPRAIIKDVKKY